MGTKTTSKARFSSILAGISLALLTVGILVRMTGYPNQLLFYISGLALFIFFFIPIKAIDEFKLVDGTGKKLSQVVTAIVSMMLFILAPMIIMDGSSTVFILAAISLIFLAINVFLVKQRQLVRLDIVLIIGVILSLLNAPIKSQAPHKLFSPIVLHPAYPAMDGPTVYLDEAHHNFHTLDGLYYGFGEVLRKDGYQTRPITEKFTAASLEDKEIIVIANALNEKNEKNWINPTYSAFTENEQQAMADWVRAGGSLFLIADHMPISGAAADLAAQFGIQFINGFAMDTLNQDDWFLRANNTLRNNEITNGVSEGTSVDSIITFTGQAFIIPDSAVSILTFGREYLQWEPDTAWRFGSVEPYNIEGYSQGMYMKFGKGRVVAFGEAMMFTSQLGWGLSWMKLGLSNPKAKNNQQLLLNIIHWLDTNQRQ